MKKLLMMGLLGVAVSVFATTAEEPAAPVSEVVASEVAKPAAEAAKPKAVAVASNGADLVGQCAACHGKDGNSAAPNYPKLAGQNAAYLLKQLKDIKSGERNIAVMTGQLDTFSDAQLASIAAFYAKQDVTLNQAQDKYLELGEKVYRLGNLEKGLPACTGCHSPTGKGNSSAGFPALGGQHAAYIAESLKAFRTGSEYQSKGRKNDQQGVMRAVAAKMSDKEIEAVSNFISGLYVED